jgi:hypothetical protein
MGVVQRTHVEGLALFTVICGIFVLETLILPQTPTDAFTTSNDPHAAYEGRLQGQEKTRQGFTYEGELCKRITVWSRQRAPINQTVRITGEINEDTLFAEEVEKTS